MFIDYIDKRISSGKHYKFNSQSKGLHQWHGKRKHFENNLKEMTNKNKYVNKKEFNNLFTECDTEIMGNFLFQLKGWCTHFENDHTNYVQIQKKKTQKNFEKRAG